MKVTHETWQERLANLNRRREAEVIKNAFPAVDDYKSHVYKCHIGKKVIDVGCGLQIIKPYIEELGFEYNGLDIPNVCIPPPDYEGTIEENNFFDKVFDTAYLFMVIDGVRDIEIAAKELKRITKTNIVILNGINIHPDRYHTINITEEVLQLAFGDLRQGYREWITDKVLLTEYLL